METDYSRTETQYSDPNHPPITENRNEIYNKLNNNNEMFKAKEEYSQKLKVLISETYKPALALVQFYGVNVTSDFSPLIQFWPAVVVKLFYVVLLFLVAVSCTWLVSCTIFVLEQAAINGGMPDELPECMIGVFGLINLVVLMTKRKELEELIPQLWKNASSYENQFASKEFRSCRRYVIFMVLVVLASNALSVTMNVMLYREEKNTELFFKIYLFGAKCEGVFGDIMIILIVISFYFLIAILDIFILFFCLNSWLMKTIVRKYKESLQKRDCITLIKEHKVILRSISALDSAVCNNIFWVCMMCLIMLYHLLSVFMDTRIEMQKHVTVHYLFEECTYVYKMIVMILYASRVTEELESLRDSVHYIDPDLSIELASELIMNICTDETHVSMWKMLEVRRVTAFSIFGTLLTYGIIAIQYS